MRFVLCLFLSALLWVTSCAYAQTNEMPYQIDEQATAQAPWKVGDIIADGTMYVASNIPSNVYRKFLGVTNRSYFVVQDFYQESHNKVTDPYVIVQQDVVADIMESHRIQPFDGMLIFWYENGSKMREAHYHNGKRQGTWTLWHENGQKGVEIIFQDNEPYAHRTSWYDNGKKESEGELQDEKRQGLWVRWDKEGKKMSEIVYEAGKEVSKKAFN